MEDELDPELKSDDEGDDFGADPFVSKGKPKSGSTDDDLLDDDVESIEKLLDEEDGLLPEDSYDDPSE